ncbi:hypothetical protein HYS97_02015 [Candidatus Daviesbacteria bacterium]|nr:hypothetical protein [Candidatus Daviesbacteria bacterium]
MSSFIESAPIMYFPAHVFERPASYSATLKRVVSLREYIAVKMPDQAQGLGFQTQLKPDDVKEMGQLTRDEMKKITLETFAASGLQANLVAGEQSYTPLEIFQEIKKGTRLGTRLTYACINNISFQLQLAKAGKLRLEGLENKNEAST